MIHDLGSKLVRIFLVWENFQPAPDKISTSSLNNLATVCDIAKNNDLKLDVTFFTGLTSGYNWAPSWLLHGKKPIFARKVVSGGVIVNRGILNLYSNPMVFGAQILQLRTVIKALRDHPSIWCWNLGNEPDIFAQPPSDAAGEKWAIEMVATIREIDPNHPVTCGLHLASLVNNNGLRLDRIFPQMDLAVMHTYPLYAMPLAKNPLDADFVPFTCGLAAALSGKAVLMEEFGGCTAPPGKDSFNWMWMESGHFYRQFMASEEALAQYFAQVLPRLVDSGAIGALVWCFADYHPSLWEKPPCSGARHERHFGLIRPEARLKPHANVIKAFSLTQPQVISASRAIHLPFTNDEYYKHPLLKIWKLYKGGTMRQVKDDEVVRV